MESNNPTSQARVDANRANAQSSTGPKTPEGKARVSQNHRIHGFTSTRIQIENPEDQEAFDELRALQLTEHDPQSSSEQHLFEEILHSMWIIEKVRIHQGQMLDAEGLDGLKTEEQALQKAYDRLERYATRAQNTWFRCRKMLKIIQNERIAIQSQADLIDTGDLVEELKAKAQQEHEPPPPKATTPDLPEEELSEAQRARSAPPYRKELAKSGGADVAPFCASSLAERKIMQLDPTDPQFKAKAEHLIQEDLLAEFAKFADDLKKCR